MLKARIATCMLLLAPALSSGATVVTDTNVQLSVGPTSADYTVTVYQDAAGTDPTSILFDYDGTNLEVISWTLDEESDWYLVRAGQVFSFQNIDSGLFTSVFTTDSPAGSIAVGSEFFLGFSTGQGFGAAGPNRDAFGWIELMSSVSGLVAGGNAIAYEAGGIVVGSAISVPEPATALLLFAGLLGLRSPRQRKITSQSEGLFPCNAPKAMRSTRASRRA